MEKVFVLQNPEFSTTREVTINVSINENTGLLVLTNSTNKVTLKSGGVGVGSIIVPNNNKEVYSFFMEMLK